MKRLRKKNTELAIIAKRLEERARKLQEANLKVVRSYSVPSFLFLYRMSILINYLILVRPLNEHSLITPMLKCLAERSQ